MASFFKTLFRPDENAEIVKLLTDSLHVKIAQSTISKEIGEHPDYPSLLSISDVLTTHGIENTSLKIEPADLEKLPLPFVAVLKDDVSYKDSFSLIKSISDQNIEYYNLQNHAWENISREQFFKKWPSQIVLIADAENAISEKDYEQKVSEEKRKVSSKLASFLLLPALLIISCILMVANFGSSSLTASLFALITLAGSITGGLLLWYELDEYNPALQQICSAGKKINCGAILNSKASKIFGISWSTIGFTYFSGGLLLLLFGGINNVATLFILSWLNVLAAPYIFYSVYYQWRIAKQWCVLCLSVQALLALQLVTAIASGWHTAIPVSAIISYQIIIPVLLAYGIPFIVVSLLIPAFRASKESKNNKQELQRLKHNSQIFEALLEKQKHITENPEGLGLILGNPNAKNKIIKVCNPYCGPCAQAHPQMEALLDNNNDLQIQIIFTATNDPNDIKTPPVKHLLAIAETSDETHLKHALDDWYLADKKDYDVFAGKYPMNGELNNQDGKIQAMREWCDKTEIAFTPTFFVSLHANEEEKGFYQLPELYSVSDLKYFLTV